MNEEQHGASQSWITNRRVKGVAAFAILMVGLWAAVEALSGLKEFRYIGAGVSATNTISISGEGEVFAVPDIATFSVSVVEEAADVETAQAAATQKINDIIAYLEDEAGVAERDIKTENYNVYPRYEYRENVPGGIRVPEGERVLVGFEVSQTLSVKVRDTERAGEILSQIGARGVSNVSGLSFTIDDEEDLQAEARALAIADAQAKAEALADDLGVSLIRIVGFYEDGGGYPVPYAQREGFGAADVKLASAPQLPVGENKLVSNVNITYEIR